MTYIINNDGVCYFSKNLAIRCEGRKVERQEERSSQPRSEFKVLGFLHTWQGKWGNKSKNIIVK